MTIASSLVPLQLQLISKGKRFKSNQKAPKENFDIVAQLAGLADSKTQIQDWEVCAQHWTLCAEVVLAIKLIHV